MGAFDFEYDDDGNVTKFRTRNPKTGELMWVPLEAGDGVLNTFTDSLMGYDLPEIDEQRKRIQERLKKPSQK